MRRGRPLAPLNLTGEERETPLRWPRRPKTAQALALRSRIILACAHGLNVCSSPLRTSLVRRRHVRAEATRRGRFVKPIGDTVLLTFPLERATQAIEALRGFQSRSTSLWRAFDERCRVRVKAGAGPVQFGLLGAAGAERFDIVGDALNSLFKAPWSDFDMSPDVTVLRMRRHQPLVLRRG